MANLPLIIVSCTDRKSLATPKTAMARSLPKSASVDDAASKWVSVIRHQMQTTDCVPLRDLYQGEYWKIALSIESRFDTLVASAGIGMHGFDDPGIGYNATFTKDAADSIVRSKGASVIEARQEWWSAIHRRGSVGSAKWKSDRAPSRGRRNVFVAVSEGYQHAISQDLIEIADKWANVVIVSGSKPFADLVKHPHIEHVQVGQELRMVLGGSTPCVGIRFLEDVLIKYENPSFDDTLSHLEVLNRRYKKLAPHEKLPVISRQTFANDDEVVAWIRNTIRKEKLTNPTKSGLIRRLRDEGRACEQKRFGNLFEIALDGPHGTRPASKKMR